MGLGHMGSAGSLNLATWAALELLRLLHGAKRPKGEMKTRGFEKKSTLFLKDTLEMKEIFFSWMNVEQNG